MLAAIAGGAGGGIANIALSPANSGASLLNSYWYGAGLILGERDMYTFHWEKIKKRLESGEDYLSVLESEMNPAITAISAYSLQIMQKTGELYKQAGVGFLINLVEDLLNPFFTGDRTDLLNFTLAQIQLWTDTELRAAFENKTSYALYNFTTQLIIKEEYDRRFVETEPVPETEVVSKESEAYILKYSQGRVFFLTNISKSILFSQASSDVENPRWDTIATGTFIDMVTLANQSWPVANGYDVKSFGVIDVDHRYYWILKNRL